MAADVARIDVLQESMWAQGKHALSAVFQAWMRRQGRHDPQGVRPVDPLGLITTSFKKPTSGRWLRTISGACIRRCRRAA